MSSDESSFDPHTSQPTYTIVKPSWRHPDLHDWLRVFDQLHHRNHVNSWSLDKRGAFTHIRAGSQAGSQHPHYTAFQVLCPTCTPLSFGQSCLLVGWSHFVSLGGQVDMG